MRRGVQAPVARTHNIVELLEGELLGLREEKEDHDTRQHVQARVETKRASRRHGLHHRGPGETEDAGPEEAGGNGPAHADLTVGDGEHFCGVGEAGVN